MTVLAMLELRAGSSRLCSNHSAKFEEDFQLARSALQRFQTSTMLRGAGANQLHSTSACLSTSTVENETIGATTGPEPRDLCSDPVLAPRDLGIRALCSISCATFPAFCEVLRANQDCQHSRLMVRKSYHQ